MADYMVGSRGPEVQNIQRRLISNGYRLKADGNFNSQSVAVWKPRRKLLTHILMREESEYTYLYIYYNAK